MFYEKNHSFLDRNSSSTLRGFRSIFVIAGWGHAFVYTIVIPLHLFSCYGQETHRQNKWAVIYQHWHLLQLRKPQTTRKFAFFWRKYLVQFWRQYASKCSYKHPQNPSVLWKVYQHFISLQNKAMHSSWFLHFIAIILFHFEHNHFILSIYKA